MRITELATLLNVQIVMLYPNYNGEWCCHIKGALTKDDKNSACLVSASGTGATPKEAITDYINKIKGKLLIIDAYGEDRKEFKIPMSLTLGQELL